MTADSTIVKELSRLS